ncbi:hypothetical protein J6590_028293 [Homalodisca vitripennis]|nr:hypothetical protein J6590_028293 [Homalodisca vitripennis]
MERWELALECRHFKVHLHRYQYRKTEVLCTLGQVAGPDIVDSICHNTAAMKNKGVYEVYIRLGRGESRSVLPEVVRRQSFLLSSLASPMAIAMYATTKKSL